MVGTLEEGLSVVRRRSVTDKLDDYDRTRLGGSVRIDIPWTDAVTMREIGEILIGLGTDMKAYSTRGDLDSFEILSALKAKAMRARHRILEAAGPRPEVPKQVHRLFSKGS